jgi:hypothetical protein
VTDVTCPEMLDIGRFGRQLRLEELLLRPLQA